jgi:16S rRNA G527 N7-methylase RsmG
MGQPLGWYYSRTIIVIFFVFEFVNNIPIQFWVIVMKRLKLINQRVIQKKIENFKNKDIDNSQILIDDASAELSNIFTSAASISLKRGTKSKKSCKDKKWHDTDLKSLRRKSINYVKVYSKFPHDPNHLDGTTAEL